MSRLPIVVCCELCFPLISGFGDNPSLHHLSLCHATLCYPDFSIFFCCRYPSVYDLLIFF